MYLIIGGTLYPLEKYWGCSSTSSTPPSYVYDTSPPGPQAMTTVAILYTVATPIAFYLDILFIRENFNCRSTI